MEIKNSPRTLESGLNVVQTRLSESESLPGIIQTMQCKKVQKVQKEQKGSIVCKQIEAFTNKLDELENRSRRNNIIIFGLQEADNEIATSLGQVVVKDIMLE